MADPQPDDSGPAFDGANFTVRDLIAFVALHGMLSSPPIGPRSQDQAPGYAEAAYWFADAVLRVRKASQA